MVSVFRFTVKKSFLTFLILIIMMNSGCTNAFFFWRRVKFQKIEKYNPLRDGFIVQICFMHVIHFQFHCRPLFRFSPLQVFKS